MHCHAMTSLRASLHRVLSLAVVGGVPLIGCGDDSSTESGCGGADCADSGANVTFDDAGGPSPSSGSEPVESDTKPGADPSPTSKPTGGEASDAGSPVPPMVGTDSGASLSDAGSADGDAGRTDSGMAAVADAASMSPEDGGALSDLIDAIDGIVECDTDDDCQSACSDLGTGCVCEPVAARLGGGPNVCRATCETRRDCGGDACTNGLCALTSMFNPFGDGGFAFPGRP